MAQVKTPAFALRLVAYGDDDLVITLYTREAGRVSVAAKSARKSRKRFGTSLDLFSELSVMYGSGPRRKGMPLLSEASCLRQFPEIRKDAALAGYAGAWTELVLHGTAEGEKSEEIYGLYISALALLDGRLCPASLVHAWFFMRFLSLSGVGPRLSECVRCRKPLPPEAKGKVAFRHASGGILCKDCALGRPDLLYADIDAVRLLSALEGYQSHPGEALEADAGLFAEAGSLLSGFVSHHLGLRIKSLEFLRKLIHSPAREEGPCRNA